MPHRSFDLLDLDEIVDSEGVSFDLSGEKFDCLPEVPAVAMRFLGTGTTIGVARGLDYIEACLADDATVERFRATLAQRDRIVTRHLTAELTAYLIESYTSRPTKPPSD